MGCNSLASSYLRDAFFTAFILLREDFQFMHLNSESIHEVFDNKETSLFVIVSEEETW